MLDGLESNTARLWVIEMADEWRPFAVLIDGERYDVEDVYSKSEDDINAVPIFHLTIEEIEIDGTYVKRIKEKNPDSIVDAEIYDYDPELEEAFKWVRLNGSSRLQKAAAVGLLDHSIDVYREERLAKEMPGWSVLDRKQKKNLMPIRNPPEWALDEYIALLKQSIHCDLQFLIDRPVAISQFLGCIIMKDIKK